MSDVFVLGAGFSKAICDSMPILSEMREELLDHRNLHIPSPSGVTGDNFEHLMTYLSQPQPWLVESENLENRAAFLRVVIEIGDYLQGCTDSTIGQGCPEWLKLLVAYWHHHQSSVITFNYDTLIERALCYVEPISGQRPRDTDICPVILSDVRRSSIWDGNPVDSFTLYKLHGSVHWYYSGASSYFGEAIYRAYISDWNADVQDIEWSSRQAALDKVPLIIPPTTEKVGYFQHESIRRIWHKASEALLFPSRVYCIGYSLPETDLAVQWFLRRAFAFGNSSKRPTLVVVNRDSESVTRYRSLLGDLYEIDAQYVGVGAVEALVAAIT